MEKMQGLKCEVESDRREDRLVTVATYNVHRCIGMDGRIDPDRIARVIHELNADIMGLQEVVSKSGKRADEAQMDYLAHRTGLKAIPGPTIQRGKGHYGNVLMTNLPVLESRCVDISVHLCEPRGVIDAVLEVRNSPVRIIVTHLGLNRAERRSQARRLGDLLSQGEPLPTILLGDINEWLPFSISVRTINSHLGRGPALRTFPARFPFLALDRIWVRPAELLSSLSVHKSPEARVASDHLPLKAAVLIPQA
jgi:endonuclease/exonuclease/phosphatase family metal-dependent hydrolase